MNKIAFPLMIAAVTAFQSQAQQVSPSRPVSFGQHGTNGLMDPVGATVPEFPQPVYQQPTKSRSLGTITYRSGEIEKQNGTYKVDSVFEDNSHLLLIQERLTPRTGGAISTRYIDRIDPDEDLFQVNTGYLVGETQKFVPSKIPSFRIREVDLKYLTPLFQ